MSGGHEDFLTQEVIKSSAAAGDTWETFPRLAWSKIFEQQYQYCTDDKTNPIHHCIAEKFELRKHCMQNGLIPVVCDEQIPTQVTSAIEGFTRISDGLWTTKFADVPGGPFVIKSPITLNEMAKEMLDAKISDARPKDEENEQELKQACQEELELLDEKANPDDGPARTFSLLQKRITQLETDMKLAPPARWGQFMQFRSLQSAYLDRLAFALRAQSILERGQSRLHELLKNYKSDTEIMWWDLESFLNCTSCCPLLDATALQEQFIYQGLVPDDIGAGDIYKKPPKMSDTVSHICGSLIPEQEDLDTEIKELGEEIEKLEADKSNVSAAEQKKKDRDLRVKKKQLEVKKDSRRALQRTIKSAKTASKASLDQSGKCDQMENEMKAALDKAQENFAEMANSNTSLKAVWKAVHEEGTSFTTKTATKSIQSQQSHDETYAHMTEDSGSVTVGGGFGGFGGSATVGGSHATAESHAEGTQHAKSSKFHFECEGAFGKLENRLLDTVLKAFNNDKWYMEDNGEEKRGPGYLWKGNKSVRYYVAEIFFARKLVMYTSDSDASGKIVAATTKSTNSVNVGGSATGWGVTVAVNAAHSASDSHSQSDSSMQKNSRDDSSSHGNLYIKFLLLKPFMPAPMRSKDTLTEDVGQVEYANKHLLGAAD